jgi:hypothetical protein
MMNTLTHSQAHAAGDLASVGATAGRIARINESRALAASEHRLFNGALQAMRSVAMTPERVQQLLATLNACLEADPHYLPGRGNYAVRVAVLEAFCTVQEDVNPDLEDLAELAGRVA